MFMFTNENLEVLLKYLFYHFLHSENLLQINICILQINILFAHTMLIRLKFFATFYLKDWI